MRISAKLAVSIAAIFTVICLGFAFTGFMSFGEIADPAQAAADAKGFASFWMFLAAIAVVFGLLSWWIMRSERSNRDT